jgi:hypothetical protein
MGQNSPARVTPRESIAENIRKSAPYKLDFASSRGPEDALS